MLVGRKLYLLISLVSSWDLLIDGSVRIISKKGDINIAVFLSLCLNRRLNVDSLLMLEAIDSQINRNNLLLKRLLQRRTYGGITSGYVIYDTCGESENAIKDVFEIGLEHVNTLSRSNRSCCAAYPSRKDEILVLAKLQRDESSLLLNLLLVANKPYVALSRDNWHYHYDQSNKGNYRSHAQNFDVFKVYVKIIKEMKWKNYGLIYSNNSYGVTGYLRSLDIFKKEDFCFSAYYMFTSGTHNISNHAVMKTLKRDAYIDVVILWLTVEDSIHFFHLAKQFSIFNRTWLAGPVISYLPSSYFRSFEPFVIQGMIIVKRETVSNPKYLLRPRNVAKWGKITNTTTLQGLNKTHLESLAEQITPHTIDLLDDTVTTLMIFQQDILKHILKHYSKPNSYIINQIQRHSVNLRTTQLNLAEIQILQINKINRTIYFATVATVETSGVVVRISKIGKSVWAGYKDTAPVSNCHDICQAGFEPIYTNKKCCFICEKCEEQYYQPRHGKSNCLKCPSDTESNTNRTLCSPYTNKYITYNCKEAYVVLTLMAVGVIVTLMFCILFIRHKATPVVRSSIFSLSITQLITHLILFLVPLASIGQINDTSCIITLVMQGQLICFLLSIIFSKTMFLVGVFQSKTVLAHSTIVRSFQHVWLLVIQIIYGLIVTAALYYSPNGITPVKNKDTLVNELICENFTLMVSQFTFILLLTAVCMVQAFRARQLPSYYNDGDKILYASFGVILTLIIAALLHPSLKDINHKFLHFQLFNWLINVCVLIFMFALKVWIILFKPAKNNIHAFKEVLYNNTTEKINSKIIRRKNRQNR
ncbi:uncharacterized protein LOC130647741 [Hydractinia symbiolongicarpus]|uniref:uncharacterized protein LOC130647741 n=1 Tax=Hydractinia symbiolongicarpus TaxID=13093 RepID=UPI00254D112B|nr:uncharacterized protein LOC130647741 [Hydractinia symbiolongicarpus]